MALVLTTEKKDLLKQICYLRRGNYKNMTNAWKAKFDSEAKNNGISLADRKRILVAGQVLSGRFHNWEGRHGCQRLGRVVPPDAAFF